VGQQQATKIPGSGAQLALQAPGVQGRDRGGRRLSPEPALVEQGRRDEQEDAIRKHQSAANGAVEEWNSFDRDCMFNGNCGGNVGDPAAREARRR
jgi:hypothetical protein